MPSQPPHWLGRRGAILAILGSTWVVQAAAILAGGWHPIPVPDLHAAFPRWAQALPWAVAGALVLAGAGRRHPTQDRVGFAAAIVMPSLMVALWLVALAFAAAQGAPRGVLVGGAAAAWTWLSVALMLLTIAGWAETPSGFAPPPRARRSRSRGEKSSYG